MKIPRWAIALLFSLSPVFIVSATAQEDVTKVIVPKDVIEVPATEPLILDVTELVDANTANVTVIVQTAGGEFVILTPCDGDQVECKNIEMDIEDVEEGAQFYLNLDEETGDGSQA